jgi:hypothetical protein
MRCQRAPDMDSWYKKILDVGVPETGVDLQDQLLARDCVGADLKQLLEMECKHCFGRPPFPIWMVVSQLADSISEEIVSEALFGNPI